MMSNFTLEDFNYDLPESFIAQQPLEKRDHSKLLVFNRATDETEVRQFFNILEYLKAGDVLVINTTRVIPARLLGLKRGSTVKIEVLLLKKLSGDTYQTLIKPGRRLHVGDFVNFRDKLAGEVIFKNLEDGMAQIKFSASNEILDNLIEELGETPLPQYIKSEGNHHRDRYQTVYNNTAGSAAAPTAGLHWTPELMQKARDMGVIFCEVLLHVGMGTFRPVKVDDITEHKMHAEYYEITEDSAEIINKAKREGRRVICVGTTSMRTVEGNFAKHGATVADACETEIFIYPPYKFGVADALITNFHLPKSSLIMLVSAFTSREKTLELYEFAKQESFRFFSFGDCMLLI